MSVSNLDARSEASINNFSLAVQKQLDAMEDRGWEVTITRHPLKPEPDITLRTKVGVLTHSVKIESRYNVPTDTLHGYRVTTWHDQQVCDPGIVSRQAHTLDNALTEARDELERLTE
jgi:hypothetical protein